MTDPLNYDEATLSALDGEGFSLVVEREPTANVAGVGTSLLDALTDFVNYGVSNGNFRKGPPDPSANITTAGSTQTASNLLPDWRFQQSSNTNITLTQARDTSSPSGSNARFTFASGAAGDEAYIEQLIDVGGARARWQVDALRHFVIAGAANTGTFGWFVRAQYLTTDGAITGMPAEATISGTIAAGVTFSAVNVASATAPPGTARYLRLRVGVSRSGAATSAVGTVDFSDVRRDSGKPYVLLPDTSAPQTYTFGQINQAAGAMSLSANAGAGFVNVAKPRLTGGSTLLEAAAPSSPAAGDLALYATTDDRLWTKNSAGGVRPLNVQLVSLSFVQLNIPAGTTANMPLSENGAPAQIPIPWGGSIVGVSYRMDGTISAGTLNVRAKVNGTNVWTAHALDSASGADGEATQAVGADVFVAGDILAVDLVSSGGFTPTTRDIVVVLWLALDYDGA